MLQKWTLEGWDASFDKDEKGEWYKVEDVDKEIARLEAKIEELGNRLKEEGTRMGPRSAFTD
jgi:hypothetical protein